MDIKITNFNSLKNSYSNYQSKPLNYKNQIIIDNINFSANPTKSLKELSNKEKRKLRIKHFFPVQKLTKESKKMIREISQKYLEAAGLPSHNLLTYEKTPYGGYFNPLRTDIVINAQEPINVGLSKFIESEEKYNARFRKTNFYLPCHESQHKVQATQIYRLAGRQNEVLELMEKHIQNERILINKLKKGTLLDDEIIKLQQMAKDPQNQEKLEEIQKRLILKKMTNKALKRQIKIEDKKLKYFDLNKVKKFYDEVLEKKGPIPQGSQEEAEALKYLDTFTNSPQLLSKYLKAKEFESAEAQKEYRKNLANTYDNSYLEIDADSKANAFMKKNEDLFQHYYKKINKK